MPLASIGVVLVMHTWLTLVACTAVGPVASPTPDAPNGVSQTINADAVWQTVNERDLPLPKRTNLTGRYAVLRLNKAALEALLAGAPHENDPPNQRKSLVVSLPLPDGRFGRFQVVESPLYAPGVFPEIKNFSGQGIDDPTATTRFGWTASGFHAVIIAAGGSVYIDRYAFEDGSIYVSYHEGDVKRDGPR